uniref:Uncharacterized protein n=1 Tax=Trypanosoma congolense (strain IL3000) TaxID=1068625 RepID=G0UQX0_TRYCI|nr:hypothetical protein, unlikely [Trypanosoma congolense IL3000]
MACILFFEGVGAWVTLLPVHEFTRFIHIRVCLITHIFKHVLCDAASHVFHTFYFFFFLPFLLFLFRRFHLTAAAHLAIHISSFFSFGRLQCREFRIRRFLIAVTHVPH